ncbi:MAG: hypothetical protein AAGG01_18515 [Planctomycetota bacterium]
MSRVSPTSVLIASSVAAVILAAAVPNLGVSGTREDPDADEVDVGARPIMGVATLRTTEAADAMGNLVSRTIRAPWHRGQSVDDWAASLLSTESATVSSDAYTLLSVEDRAIHGAKLDQMPVSTAASWTTVRGSRLSIELKAIEDESAGECADRHLRAVNAFYAQFEPAPEASLPPETSGSQSEEGWSQAGPREAAFQR